MRQPCSSAARKTRFQSSLTVRVSLSYVKDMQVIVRWSRTARGVCAGQTTNCQCEQHGRGDRLGREDSDAATSDSAIAQTFGAEAARDAGLGAESTVAESTRSASGASSSNPNTAHKRIPVVGPDANVVPPIIRRVWRAG